MMKFPRREFLHLAASAAALPMVWRSASALDYPARPVRIVVGFPPGGGADIVARLVGQWLSERLGQAFIIENRPGAAGNIAAEAVVRASPDGYTLLMVTSTNAVNAALYSNLKFNLGRDTTPVAGMTRDYFVLVVNPSLPVKTVAELIAYAKANPGKLNYASAGNGSGQHVSAELFKLTTGIDMVHVPYRGSAPALTELMAGRVQMTFEIMTASIGYIRAGRLRALAVTSPAHLAALPDVPCVSDVVPGFEASNFRGLNAPRNTPAEIVERLNKEINASLADPKIKARITDLGATVLPMSPAEFGELVTDETAKWAKVIKAANIKPG